MARVTLNCAHAANGHYVSLDQARLVLSKAEQLGISPREILRQARISYSLTGPPTGMISHMPIRDFFRLREVALESIRALAEQNSYQRMRRCQFELMCHALITSMTLHEAIERLVWFLEIGRGADGSADLVISEETAILALQLGSVEKAWEPFFAANSFAVFSRLFSWMIGQPLDARYESPLAQDPEGQLIASMFAIPLQPSADLHRMIFPGSLLKQPVVRDGADLRLLLESFPADVVVSKRENRNLKEHIAALYRKALMEGRPPPRLDDLARAIGMGSSTLRRQIEAEGFSIRAVKAHVLTGMAQHYLSSSDLSVSEIAWRLGYSGAKAFCRAFLAGTGATPTSYREKARQLPQYAAAKIGTA